MLPQHKVTRLNLQHGLFSKKVGQYSNNLNFKKRVTGRALIDPSEVYNKVYSGGHHNPANKSMFTSRIQAKS